MTTSLCVLALHGRVAIDGNYSESVVVSVCGSGCGWSCMVSYASFRDRQHPTVQNLMATRRWLEILKNDLQPLGKGGGFPWGPVGRGFYPWAGSCMCGVRLYSFAVER
eukprot:6020481-Prymnesium_polylepis.1